MEKQYYVYIMTNWDNTALYTGITNDLRRRVYEHREGMIDGFTKKYRAKKLVYYEMGESPLSAIEREKQIKAGSRRKKLALIESINPEWKDLWDDISG